MSKTRKSFNDSNRSTFFLIGLIISLSITWFAFEHKSFNKPKEAFISNPGLEVPDGFISPTKREKKEKPKPKIDEKSLNLVDNEKETKFEPDINIETTPDEVIGEIGEELDNEQPVLVPDKEVFVSVQEMPKYKGGSTKLYEYIYGNIEYPELAREMGVTGIVYVNFVVRSDGSIDNVNITRGIGYGCDKEVLKMMKAMPDWIPGEQRGRKVNVEYNLSVKFKLLN